MLAKLIRKPQQPKIQYIIVKIINRFFKYFSNTFIWNKHIVFLQRHNINRTAPNASVDYHMFTSISADGTFP